MKIGIKKYYYAGFLGAGAGSVSFLPLGGNGSTPPSSGGLTVLVGVCGNPGGPVNGATTWQRDELIGATNVEVMIVNNNPEVSIGDDPDFTFDPVTGTIDRAPNIWSSAAPYPDTAVVWYTPAS